MSEEGARLAEQYPEEYAEFKKLWEEESQKCILCSHPFLSHEMGIICRQCKGCRGFRAVPSREYILIRVKARLGIKDEVIARYRFEEEEGSEK